MKITFFVKAKFPPVDGVERVPAKARFDDRDRAFAYIGQMLADGATSVTIRPEQPRS